MFTNQLYYIPFTFAGSIMTLNLIVGIFMYLTTKKRSYAVVGGLYATSVITSVYLFSQSGSELAFLATPFKLFLTSLVITHMAVYYFYFQKQYQELVIPFVVSLVCLISSFVPNPWGSIIIVASLLVFSFLAWTKEKQVSHPFLHISHVTLLTLFSVSALLALLLHSKALYFLFSCFIALWTITLFLLFFDRIVTIMRVASYNSITDPLTGLFNKGFFLKQMKRLTAKQEVSVIFSDIDNFKKLNDTKGHEEGDKILKEVGRIMQEVVAGSGFACRYGGEEIVAIITNGNAAELAEQYRTRVEAETIVTVSVGVASGTDDKEVIKQADELMYQSKTNGKNRVSVAV